MTRSAARVNDLHLCPLLEPSAHVGGPIVPPGAPRTLINGRPAARVTDKADCSVALDDTVRGGLLTVFIDGKPASREGDSTDAGLIIGGSPDVMLGEGAAGPLTPFQVEWLYKYLNSQRDTIPFEYADNGCEARADRMCELISALGVPVEKQWLRATRVSGQLRVAIPKYPRGGVKWKWHVAPVIEVSERGGSQRMVIDPSLGFKTAVTVEEWIQKQTTRPGAVVTSSTSKDVYRRAWDMRAESWVDTHNEMRDSDTTQRDLHLYRKKRAEELPQQSGRRVPNNPVHW